MEVPFSTLGKTQKCRFSKSIRFGTGNKPMGREFQARPQTSASTRSCSFGIGERSWLFNSNDFTYPSPNAYTITPEPISGPIMEGKPQSENSIKRVSQMPGPGAYDPYSHSIPKKFTIRKRIIPKELSLSPGPCAYKPNSKLVSKKLAGGFIPTSKRSKSFKEKQEEKLNPGPGAYKIPSCFGENKLNFPIIKYKSKK